MKRTEAIQKFLVNKSSLAQLYTPSMEVQINVAKDEGEPVDGVYAGVRWQGFTDGLTTWKAFRIPWKAATEPQYDDNSQIHYDISKHAEAIGMTGWDFVQRQSLWVAFDFDSIISHKEGLTGDELSDIKQRLTNIDFVTLYSSTSSLGIHVYIFLSNSPKINNHTEHAALARAILARVSALSGIKLEAKVDAMGGNMWVWHRRAIPESFQCLKEGIPLEDIPLNWKSYLDVVSRKTLVPKETTTKDLLVASQYQIPLDSDHRRLLAWFEAHDTLWWWDDKRYMLVCHTFDLKRAHKELSLKGYFDTLAEGKDTGHDQNAFAFPENNGAWIIRRHTRGVTEHSSWYADSSGWTTCIYNKSPSLRTASKLTGGIEGEKDYNFKALKDAHQTLIMMDIYFKIPPGMANRETSIKQSERKVIISFSRNDDDEDIDGWIKKKNQWQKTFFQQNISDEIELPDNTIRHIVAGDVDLGWCCFTNNHWVQESRANINSVLIASGHSKKELDVILGRCILNNWRLVTKPFKPEYPGNREWNRNAAQFRFNPEKGKHPSWDLIFQHCGAGLTEALQKNEWANEQGILTGELYLLAWVSALFKEPEQPLPYLAFCGKPNTGKSIFHEALHLLVTTGIVRADTALVNPSGFNGELANAFLCVVEETNLSKSGVASDRIKDWVTGRHIAIRKLYRDSFDIPNCTHWIQCANEPSYCPILPGDARIILCDVEKIPTEIPKSIFLEQLEKEAPAIIHTIFNFDLPPMVSRLRLPIITTESKKVQEEQNKSPVSTFIEERMFSIKGACVLYSSVYGRFKDWLGEEGVKWTNRRFSLELLNAEVTKGRWGPEGQIHLGNLSFENEEADGEFSSENGKLLFKDTIKDSRKEHKKDINN